MPDNDSRSADKKQKKDEFAEPQLELTLPGVKEPSWFGQVVNSGLNAIGSVTGRKKSGGFVPTGAPPDLAPPPSSKPKRKSGANDYAPTWGQGGKNPEFEHTNFSSAIGEFEIQLRNPQANKPQIPFRTHHVNTGRSFLTKVVIMVTCLLLAAGTFRYLDKKYNVRQLVKDLRDPDKTKLLRKKKKPPVIRED